VGGGGEDGHVEADLGEDVLGGAGLDPVQGAQKLNGRRERAQLLLDRLREPLDLLVEEVEVGEDRSTSSACSGSKRPSSASLSAGIFLRSLPRARSASTSGSVVPRTSASSIARPETPRMSVATQSSLIPVSSSVLCSRCAACRR
jgi:hypothetical protein